jgi:hypothetical protein
MKFVAKGMALIGIRTGVFIVKMVLLLSGTTEHALGGSMDSFIVKMVPPLNILTGKVIGGLMGQKLHNLLDSTCESSYSITVTLDEESKDD